MLQVIEEEAQRLVHLVDAVEQQMPVLLCNEILSCLARGHAKKQRVVKLLQLAEAARQPYFRLPSNRKGGASLKKKLWARRARPMIEPSSFSNRTQKPFK